MDKKTEIRQGEVILLILVVVNLIEFWLAVRIGSFIVQFFAMGLLAVIDVALILDYYMHLPRVFSDEGGH
jgi:heme/copper-type cytochrome/quinol oxidase subunit 4